ncbi:hypothetical protein PoB_006514600 [Plakobranchus ocellatus]|uniref:Uncharacterized protein n=1 Tax=Plakobranchus ocellatus TaxID=259542 RepID=A0AAV4D3R5_9GAST|nr:hypothetical protein PoB_006514600 [Plakobranchus ocellatus]
MLHLELSTPFISLANAVPEFKTETTQNAPGKVINMSVAREQSTEVPADDKTSGRNTAKTTRLCYGLGET